MQHALWGSRSSLVPVGKAELELGCLDWIHLLKPLQAVAGARFGVAPNPGETLLKGAFVAERSRQQQVDAVVALSIPLLSDAVVHAAHEVLLGHDEATALHVPDDVDISAVQFGLEALFYAQLQ